MTGSIADGEDVVQDTLARAYYELKELPAMRSGLFTGQFSLVFQPLFDLEPHRLNGFEALARWVHPVRGAISRAEPSELGAAATRQLLLLAGRRIRPRGKKLSCHARVGAPLELVAEIPVTEHGSGCGKQLQMCFAGLLRDDQRQEQRHRPAIGGVERNSGSGSYEHAGSRVTLIHACVRNGDTLTQTGGA